MLPVMIALVMLCLLILFGVSLIVICVKRRKKKRRNREFEISSSETPELTYEISISQYISMGKMTDEKQENLTIISSSETPEHIYEEPDTSISQFNQKLSTLKMSNENHEDLTVVEKNVAYGSFDSIPAATIKQCTY